MSALPSLGKPYPPFDPTSLIRPVAFRAAGRMGDQMWVLFGGDKSRDGRASFCAPTRKE